MLNNIESNNALKGCTRCSLFHTNLKYASQWYRIYAQVDTNRHQAGVDIQMTEIFGMVPWRHRVEIISKCKDVDEAMFYVKQTVDEGWSKNFAEADVISLV